MFCCRWLQINENWESNSDLKQSKNFHRIMKKFNQMISCCLMISLKLRFSDIFSSDFLSLSSFSFPSCWFHHNLCHHKVYEVHHSFRTVFRSVSSKIMIIMQSMVLIITSYCICVEEDATANSLNPWHTWEANAFKHRIHQFRLLKMKAVTSAVRSTQ